MSQKARFPIPSEINPAERVCISINVPNNQGHLAAFWGNLWEMAKPYSWANDSAHSALTLGEVWRQVWFEAKDGVDCMVIPIWQMSECGIIQVSFDAGETWIDLPDLNACFPALAPGTPTRNRIIPTAINVPNLDLSPFAGQVAELLKTGTFNIFPSGVLTSASFIWTIGGAGFMSGVYGQEAGVALHPAFRQFISGLKTSIGGYSGMPEIDSMLDVNIASNTLKGIKNRAAAGQAYDMFQNLKSDNTLYSGVDKIGRYFMVVVDGEPTDSTARPGTIAVDPDAEKVWVKGASAWFDVSGGFVSGDFIKRVPTGAYNAITPETVDDYGLDIYMPEGSTKSIFSANSYDGQSFFVDYHARPVLPTETSIPVDIAGNGRLIFSSEDDGLYLSVGTTWEKVNRWQDFIEKSPDSSIDNVIEPINGTTKALSIIAHDDATVDMVTFEGVDGEISSIDEHARYNFPLVNDEPPVDDAFDGAAVVSEFWEGLHLRVLDEWRQIYVHNSVRRPIEPFYHSFMTRPGDGVSIEFDVFVPAKLLVLPFLIEDGDTIEFTQIEGWWASYSYNITNPDGGFNAFGRTYYGEAAVPAGSGDPAPSENFMALLVRYNQSTGLLTTAVTEGLILTIDDYDSIVEGIWMFPNVSPVPYYSESSGGVRVHLKVTTHE